MNAEQLVEIEERLNGRVIPRWRFWAMYWLIAAAVIAGRDLPDGFWWGIGLGGAVMGTYMALFSQYRRRSIR